MITTTIDTPKTQIISEHGLANVLLNNLSHQKSLNAAVAFAPGDIICKFGAGETLPYPTYLTVQVDIDKHITLVPEFLQYVNHSCQPNVFFNTATMNLECLTEMQPGDEFTFFYPSTEWNMSQPFVCNCCSSQCLEVIYGASKLTIEKLSRYKLTDFIRRQVKEKLSL